MSETREELESRIAAYIDGELPPAEAARLEVFLANTDPRLAEEIIGMLADRHHLRSLPRAAAPPDLAGRIMDQVERSALLNDSGHLEHQPRPWWQSRAVIAAGFILLIGGFAVFVADAVLGPAHDSKRNHLTFNPATHSPVTSSPSVDHALAAGPTPMPPTAGPASASQATADAIAPERLASAQSLQKLAKNSEKTRKIPAGAVHLYQPPPLNAKTEAALQAQLARNSVVLNGGQITAAKMGYATVNSPHRALADISAAHSNLAAEPVVLTLVARNEQDFSQLRDSLKTIMDQDPTAARQQAALQRHYAAVVPDNRAGKAPGPGVSDGAVEPAADQLAMNDAKNKEQERAPEAWFKDESAKATENKPSAGEKKATAVTGDAIENQANGSGGRGKASVISGIQNTFANVQSYQFYSPKRGAFEATSDADAQGKADLALMDKFRADRARSALPEMPAAASEPAPAPFGAAALPPPQPRMTGQLKAADDDAKQEQHAAPASPQASSQTAAQSAQAQAPAVVCYRVALRPKQLEQLARQFRVDSITSGRQAFVIAPETDDRPVAQTQDLAQAVGGDQSLDLKPTKAAKALGPEKAGSLALSVPTTVPAAATSAAQQSDWVECIITMQEPATSSVPQK